MAGEGGIPGAGLPGTTVGSDMGAAAADVVGVNPTQDGSFFQSVLYNVMANMPKGRTTMGWNAHRISNSILNGGFGGQTGAIRNHTNPRAAFRVTDPDAVINNARRGGDGYSMFNIAGWLNNGGNPFNKAGIGGQSLLESRRSNALLAARGDVEARGRLLSQLGGDSAKVDAILNTSNAGEAAVNATRSGRVYSNAVSRGLVDTGMDAYEAGVYSKISTGMRLASGHGGAMGARLAEEGMTARTAAAHYMAGAFTSRIGATYGGYMAGARTGGAAVEAAMARAMDPALSGAERAGAMYFGRGATMATQALEAGGVSVVERAAGKTALKHVTAEGVERFGARAVMAGAREAAMKEGGKLAAGRLLAVGGARMAGMAIPVVNIAMTAWLAYDIFKMGSGIIRDFNKRAAQKAREAAKSFKGQIEKPVFGMGFVDNEVAATSRSRGVMAIQNSRLNARSVLGAEAGALHAHFG